MEETADNHNSESSQSGLEDDSSEYFMNVFGAPSRKTYSYATVSN